MTFRVKNLIANIPCRSHKVDPNLLDPIGIINVNDTIWTSNAVSSDISNYDLGGNKILNVSVRSDETGNLFPTSLIYNKNSKYVNNCGEAPLLIISTLGGFDDAGTIEGYFPKKKFVETITLYKSTDNASYRGLTMVKGFIYAADFFNRKIDVLGPYNFNLNNNFSFKDDTIPADYSPYNITHIKNKIYILYAKQQEDDANRDVLGIGHGYVNIFDLQGNFIKRLISNGNLNSPWGLIKAPTEFGFPKKTILISNFGDGKINAYNKKGKFITTLKKLNYYSHIKKVNDIVNEGIRGLVKINDSVYFASAPELGINGIIGKIIKNN